MKQSSKLLIRSTKPSQSNKLAQMLLLMDKIHSALWLKINSSNSQLSPTTLNRERRPTFHIQVNPKKLLTSYQIPNNWRQQKSHIYAWKLLKIHQNHNFSAETTRIHGSEEDLKKKNPKNLKNIKKKNQEKKTLNFSQKLLDGQEIAWISEQIDGIGFFSPIIFFDFVEFWRPIIEIKK